MAFLRFSRDKRGYEHFYLVQPTTNRRVKVGRQPFDDALRRALEAQNPGVAFDWQKIVDTPIPSPDAEKWRERRRAERAERVARHSEIEAEEAAGESPSAEDEPACSEQTAEAPSADFPEVRAAQQPDEKQQPQHEQRR